MNRSTIVTAAAVVLGVLLLSGCSSKSGDSGQQGALSGSASAGSSSAKGEPKSTVLAPNTWHEVKLGMTEQQAKDAGLLGELTNNSPEGCKAFTLKESPDMTVLIAPKEGIYVIDPGPTAKTPEGIGVGSTDAEVRKAYPQAKEFRGGLSAGEYEIRIDGGIVSTVGLHMASTCPVGF
jgi:hypothetical protein